MALTKIDDRGLKTPIDLQDNEKIRLGTGNDLEVFHDGSDSKIVTSTGDLWVQTTADDLVFKAADDINFHPGTTETGLLIKHDAEVEAYYDNVKKIATKSYGVQLYDDLQLEDNNKIRLGNSGDLDIYHDGSNSYIKDAGTGGIYIDTSFLHVRQGSGESMINAVADGTVELFYNNVKKFWTNSWGCSIAGVLNLTGNIEGTQDNLKILLGGGNDLQIYHDGSTNWIDSVNNHTLIVRAGLGDAFFQGNNIYLGTEGGGEKFIDCHKDGAVELFYDNVKTFQTDGNGIMVYGPEGGTANLYLYADEGDDNADKWSFQARTDGNLNIQNYNGGSWVNSAVFQGGAAVNLYYDNSKKFETTNSGVRITGQLEIVQDYVKLNDNVNLYLGNGNDFRFYHDGSSTNFITAANNHEIKHSALKHTFYDYTGSTKRAEINSSGLDVTGAITVNGAALAGGDLVHVAGFSAANSQYVTFDNLTNTGVSSYLVRWNGVTFPSGNSRQLRAEFKFGSNWNSESNYSQRLSVLENETGNNESYARSDDQAYMRLNSEGGRFLHGELNIPMGLPIGNENGNEKVWWGTVVTTQGCYRQNFHGFHNSYTAKTQHITGIRFFSSSSGENVLTTGRIDLYKYTY